MKVGVVVAVVVLKWLIGEYCSADYEKEGDEPSFLLLKLL